MDDIKRNKTKKGRSASVDGFVRRSPAGNGLGAFGSYPASKSKNSIKPRKSGFDLPDGFNTRGTMRNRLPDGTEIGRRPIYKKDLDIDLNDEKVRGHKLLKEKKKWKRAVKKSFSGLLSLTVLFAGFLVGFAYLRANQIFQGGTSALALNCEVDPQLLEKEGDGRVNVLVLGKGGPGHTAEDLTDTVMVASLDSCQKDVGLLSIPRDLYVQMPGNGSMKINAVYSTEKQAALASGKSKKEADKLGIQATEKAVEEVIGIPIHYYALVDFEAFRRSIDTVGGVDIDVKKPLIDSTVAWENNWNPVIAEKGQQHFTGKRALLYARSRYGSERGDFDRSERQREILVALKDKVFSLGTFGNPLKLSKLFDAFGDHAHTNLSIDDIMKLYNIGQEVEGKKIVSIGLADPPNELVTTGNYGGLSVVVPKEGTYEYGAIHDYVRNALKDGFIRKENPSIMVVNGTSSPGLATKYSKILKGYGYNVTNVADAPTHEYPKNQVIDLRNGQKKYTKRYLELRFGANASASLPDGIEPGTADFVIIIGQNEADL